MIDWNLIGNGMWHPPQTWTEGLLRLGLPVLLSLVAVRVSARVLRATFPNAPVVRTLERVWSWGIWLVLALWLTGLLPLLVDHMEAISWRLGGAKVSLRTLVEGVVSVMVVMLLTLWLSAALERQLLQKLPLGTDPGTLSLRKMAANVMRTVLLLVGVLMSLSAAGIPLTALGVFGGALGVGIGLGLQKLASNYVSGFVILAERSVRIGDMVSVDGFEGRITDIKTRYTVIRALNGKESIVPNETLVTQRIENSSLADPKVVLRTEVTVAYGTDLEALFPQLVQAALSAPRVLSDPAPAVQLQAFGADGLELAVSFWIDDPENGGGNVRSDVNLAILTVLNRQGIDIPYPQRVVHSA